MAGKEGERPKLLTFQNTTSGREQVGKPKVDTAGTQLVPLMREDVFTKLSYTPTGSDPVFYPLYVLNELLYHISTRTDPSTTGSITRAIGEKYAPYQESIRKVRTAYSILAYPHFNYKGWQRVIERELETDRQLAGRDQVELTDDERLVLSQLTAARKIPFEPERQVYSYSEVPISPGVDPFGRRHLTTEEIRKMIPQED